MDLTPVAAPMVIGDDVLVNLSSIGPILGITVHPTDSGFSLQAADGRMWYCASGAGALTSDAQIIPLRSPALQQGFSLYVSSHAVAEIGRLSEEVDAASRQITFGRSQVNALAGAVIESLGGGWQTFTVPKPQTARPVSTRRSSGRAPVANPPALRERLNVGFGLGYVQGADWGLQATASGRLLGGDTGFGALVTQGAHGTVLQSSHLRWVDRESRKGIEAGDLYSETWGFVRGARYAWDMRDSRHGSALSLYLETDRTENPRPLVAYRHDVQVNNGLSACVEMGSDRSNYGSILYDLGRAGVFAYRRGLPDGHGRAQGFMASTQLKSGVSLSCTVNTSVESGGRVSDSSTLGLRLPLWHGSSLTLEQTHYDYGDSSMTSRGIGLILPVNRSLHVSVRYQQHSIDFTALAGPRFGSHSESSGLSTSMSLFANRRMHLDYQQSMYTRNGFTSRHEQLLANYRLSDRTTLQLISGFPNISDSDRLRLRLDHKLSADTSMLIEYGRQAPYQSSTDIETDHGLMIMFKKTWPLMVPSRGGEVGGTVLDQTGRPMNDVAVQLGRYTALTDGKGGYRFRCVPTGSYNFRIATESIPADCRSDELPQEIYVTRGSCLVRDFRLVPLGSISGLVFLDRNANGRFDAGEGVAEVALCADDRATATMPDGRFSFPNMEPGKHVIRIAAEVLDKRYAVQGEPSMEVEMKPAEAITGLEFELAVRKKPIFFVQMD